MVCNGLFPQEPNQERQKCSFHSQKGFADKGAVWVEIFVLVINGMRCPLTDLAAHYTGDPSDNFDIFLPAWLARYNKLIFGSIFAAAELLLLRQWLIRNGM